MDQPEKNSADQVMCPYCASSQISPVRKNYDGGLGCLGLILFGWWGLLLGLLGGGDVEMVCHNCGARWTPGRSGCISGLLSGCISAVFAVIVVVVVISLVIFLVLSLL